MCVFLAIKRLYGDNRGNDLRLSDIDFNFPSIEAEQSGSKLSVLKEVLGENLLPSNFDRSITKSNTSSKAVTALTFEDENMVWIANLCNIIPLCFIIFLI